MPPRPRARAARVLAPVAVLLALLSAPAARAAWHPLEELPVESPVYRMIEDLAGQYGFGAAFLHTQPWDRADLARFLDALAQRVPSSASDPVVVRLRRELQSGREPGGWNAAIRGEDEGTSLEVSPYARANFSEDRARRAIERDFRLGAQASVAMGPNALLFTDVFAGTTSPGGHGNPADSRRFGLIEGVQLNTYFDRSYVRLGGRRARLTLGHTWLRWGPGAWGNMALSDGAPAFDVLEARALLPLRMQLSWFVATLDPAVQSYLAGHRLELRPSPRWDVSFSELARFDGTANAPLYLVPLIPYSHAEKRVLKSSDLPSDSLAHLGKNNVMWAMDAAWQAFRGTRVYGELAIDDISFSSEWRPHALAWQLGFDARHVSGGSAWTLRGEYSRVYRFTYSVVHHHDFEFAGLPTGFPPGPDVERVNGRADWRPGPAWCFGVEGALTRKGEGRLGEFYVPGSGWVDNLVLSGVVDEDLRVAATADWSPAPGLLVGGTLGYAKVEGLDHLAGLDRSGAIGRSRLTLRW